MPENCPFTATWEKIPKKHRPKIQAGAPQGPFPCLCSAGHRDEHVIAIDDTLVYISKRSSGRPPSADPLSEVLWVRVLPETAQAIDELCGNDRSRSDVVRELLDKALQRSG